MATTEQDAMKLCNAVACTDCGHVSKVLSEHYSRSDKGYCRRWQTLDSFKVFLLTRIK